MAEQAIEGLKAHFGVTTLSGFGVQDEAVEVSAAGALLSYLKDTQRSTLGHLTRLTPYRRSKTLLLDAMTRRGLELTKTLREGKREGSLLEAIDRTSTAMGARLLADWVANPLTDLDTIRARHSAVEELLEDMALRADIRQVLGRSARPGTAGGEGGDRASESSRPERAGENAGGSAETEGPADRSQIGASECPGRGPGALPRGAGGD